MPTYNIYQNGGIKKPFVEIYEQSEKKEMLRTCCSGAEINFVRAVLRYLHPLMPRKRQYISDNEKNVSNFSA